ncbi:unnamed protein product, partial [Discosporangium mesarthrocarpum]
YAARLVKQCGLRMSRAAKNQVATRANVIVGVPGFMIWFSSKAPPPSPTNDLMRQPWTQGRRTEPLRSYLLNLCHQQSSVAPNAFCPLYDSHTYCQLSLCRCTI